jgi:hypothetical protein
MFSQYTNRKNKRKRNLRAVQYVQKNKMKMTVGRVVEHTLVYALVALIVLLVVIVLEV